MFGSLHLSREIILVWIAFAPPRFWPTRMAHPLRQFANIAAPRLSWPGPQHRQIGTAAFFRCGKQFERNFLIGRKKSCRYRVTKRAIGQKSPAAARLGTAPHPYLLDPILTATESTGVRDDGSKGHRHFAEKVAQ